MTVETQSVPLSTVGYGNTFQEVNNSELVFIVVNTQHEDPPLPEGHVLVVRLNDGHKFVMNGAGGCIKRAFKAVPVA